LSDTTAPPHPGCTAGLKAALTGRHDASFVWRCNFEVEDQWARDYVGLPTVKPLYVKDSMGERFVVADGGTNHHMAAVGVGSFVKRNFPIRSLTRYAEGAQHEYTISGPLCTPNDVIGKRVPLPLVEPGDLPGVERSGAYGPSASPGLFLSHGFPAEVLVHCGVPYLVREPDTSEELLRKQRIVRLG
jgi:diaminopimelate decarboxylase